MGGSEVAPGSRRCLPDLRLNVHSLLGVNPTADHEHISIGKCGAGRVPATVVHIRQAGPVVAEWVVGVGIGYPRVITYVPTSYQQCSIGQKGMSGAENVCSHMRKRRVRVRRWIPEGWIISIRKGWPPYDLACWQERGMHRFALPSRSG